MFLFDHAGRGAPPEGLRSPEVIEALRLIAHQLILPRAERDQTDVPLVWKQTLPGDVLAALGRLSKGRCAFCEDERSDLSVYRFRPPAYAEPIKEAEGKESYLWLSFSWQNLFPICQTCRPWRPNDFPVRGKRAACPAALREHFDGQIDSTLRPETIEALIGASSPSRALEAGSFYHPGEASPVQTKFAVSRFGYLIGKNERTLQPQRPRNRGGPPRRHDRNSSRHGRSEGNTQSAKLRPRVWRNDLSGSSATRRAPGRPFRSTVCALTSTDLGNLPGVVAGGHIRRRQKRSRTALG